MKRLFKRIQSFSLPWYGDLILLFIVGVLAYGLLISWLGYYWDDWAFIWIARFLGPAGIARYFATDSSLYGRVVQLFTSLLGTSPITWQVFGLLWRLMCTFAIWELIRLVWPGRRNLALWTSLLFLVFPGFVMQFIPVNLGFFFLFTTLFFLSLIFNFLAIKSMRLRWLCLGLSVFFSLINLIAWEYFFTLEIIRPVFLWLVLAPQFREYKSRLHKVMKWWLPNLIAFLGIVVWRIFFNASQASRYSLVFLTQLKSNPWIAFSQLLTSIGNDVYMSVIAGWGKAFRFPSILSEGTFATYAYIPVLIISFLLLFFFLNKTIQPNKSSTSFWHHWQVQAVFTGILIVFLAGWPFWLANLPMSLVFPNDRFMIPFILGAGLIATGLIGMLAWLPPRLSWVSPFFIAILASFSIGSQFLTANDYRHDWNLQRTMFWQLIWRVPSVKPNTLFFSNDLPSKFETDNSLSAPLNWIYAPEYSQGNMPYQLLFPNLRLGNILPALEKGIPITRDYRATRFAGNTSQTITFTFTDHSCLHILDPQLDPLNPMLSEIMRKAASISSFEPIADAQISLPPDNVFGNEPAKDWCYYFEKADLARQQKNWDQVVEMGDTAFGANLSPEDPIEYNPFIAGYAFSGNWNRAVELTLTLNEVEPRLQPVSCSLWQQIKDGTVTNPQRVEALQSIESSLSCGLK